MTHSFWMKTLAVLSILCAAGLHASADDTTTTTTTTTNTSVEQKPVSPGMNSVPGSEAIDDMITNNNLRALSGSKSRWSYASIFNYNGGSIETPLSNGRPNIAAASGTSIASDLDGNMSVKYNIAVQDSLMAGTGVRWIAPLSAHAPKTYTGTRTDVFNPFLTYQHLYKWLGIQSVLQVQDTQWTQADQTFTGYFQQVSVDQENAYELGTSGFTLALSLYGQYQFFNKHNTNVNLDGESTNVDTQNSLWEFAVAPIIEYQINQKFNLRTVFNYLQYEHYVNMPGTTNVHDTSTQSVGLGCSVTRDIFLYPNVQFLPWDNRASKTNVALSATINLF